MKNTILFLFAVLIFPLGSTVYAQDEEVQNTCIDRRDLLQMIHAPISDPNSTILMDLMDTKGFQLGSDNMKRYDTIGGIPLSYRCEVWYANTNGQLVPAVYTCESEQGLSNLIIVNLDYSKECTSMLTTAFHEGGYMYDGRRNVYTGRDAFDKHAGLYEAQYSDQGGQRLLAMRFQSELDIYVKKQAEIRTKHITELIARADRLTDDNKHVQALRTLDTLYGWYEPMDEMLYNKSLEIERARAAYYRQQLTAAINQRSDLEAGIAWCDSLIMVKADDDSVPLVRQMLVDQKENKLPKYSTFMPQNHRMTLDALERLINTEIAENRMDKAQSMNFEFTFLTTFENRSHGTIQLNVERSFLQSRSKERNRIAELQLQMDSLAASPLIEPVFRYGININTKESLSGRVDWIMNEVTVKGKDIEKQRELKPFIDSINNRYFTNADPTAVGKNRLKMPYRRDYTFGITRKQYNGANFNDVQLTKFKTSGPLSWMPSLLIPGLGTKNQGRISSASARAIPFFLFAGLSAAGLYLKNQDYERTEWGTGAFWKHENFDNILFYGGLSIAGTIYVVDLVQSIQSTIINRSRSKKLRKDLSKRDIDIRIDEIHIK